MDIETSVNRVGGDFLKSISAETPIRNVFKAIEGDFKNGEFAWVGDWREFALGYITFASILHAHNDSHAKPVGSFVVGKTSTGKTQFLDALCELIPEELIVRLTSASSKSLIYECREDPHRLNGKIVFVEELTGLKNPEIQYLLRVLVTKGKASHTTVLAGVNERIEIEGSISLQSTGLLGDELRDDTMNRMVLFHSDQSQQMTKRVIEDIKGRYNGGCSGNRSSLLQYHKFFLELASHPVIIPYTDKIHFDTSTHENRRAAKIFMDLLSTVALLNQSDREFDGKHVISEIEDLEILLKLSELDSNSEPDLTPSQIIILSAAKDIGGETFTYQDLAAHLSLKDIDYEISSVKKAVSKLRDFALIKVVSHSRPVVLSLDTKKAGNRFGVVFQI